MNKQHDAHVQTWTSHRLITNHDEHVEAWYAWLESRLPEDPFTGFNYEGDDDFAKHQVGSPSNCTPRQGRANWSDGFPS